MVVWVFAGGGESEIKGLILFFRKSFSDCQFERKTPINNKKAPNPKKALGKTGKSLADQISWQLNNSLRDNEKCDLILVIDDLDCRDVEQQNQLFLKAINIVKEASEIKQIIAFAAPELESWIVADWQNTFAKHIDFRGFHQGMRHWLSTKNFPFDAPESFSEYDSDKDSCKEKLSELIIEAVSEKAQKRYSKASHTPFLLQQVNPENVVEKCPLFRELYLTFNNLFKSESL